MKELRWSLVAFLVSLVACPFEDWCAKDDFTCVGEQACSYACECRYTEEKTEPQLYCLSRCASMDAGAPDASEEDADVDAGDELPYRHCEGSTVPVAECPPDCGDDELCLKDCACTQKLDAGVTDISTDAGDAF